MTTIRKTVFAAATVAVAFGAMAAGSNADAFSFGLRIGHGPGIYVGNFNPQPCYDWVKTIYGWQYLQVPCY